MNYHAYGCGCPTGDILLPHCPIHGDPLQRNDQLKLRGRFGFDIFDADGKFLKHIDILNTVTSSGITDLLGVAFAAGTQKTTWFFGLIDNAGFSAISAADTAASHAGWVESTAYTEATRQAWTPTVTGGTITNPTAPTFTASGVVTLKGAFIVSSNVKGGSAGQLWSAGAFSSTQALSTSQTLKPTYSLALG